MNLTYIGDFSQSGAAYPVINNALTAALERAGHTVYRNLHNDASGELTPIAIAHEYPPRPLNMRHVHNICLAAWEFAAPAGVPRAQVQAFNTFDAVFTPSDWVSAQLRYAVDVPVKTIRWGVDTNVFYPSKLWTDDKETIRLLWLGGTDPRHGFDIALQVLDKLPDNYRLYAKQSAHYPPQGAVHPRLRIMREDLDQVELARLYNSVDIFLQTARGVGFSLPVLEALACGLPVVSTPLPPIWEFGDDHITFSQEGYWEPMLHHLYSDCWPKWYVPNIDSLVEKILHTAPLSNLVYMVAMEAHPQGVPFITSDSKTDYSWDSAARVLIEQVEGLL